MTHCRLSCENPRSDLIEGSATFTIATSRMTMNCAVTMRASAVQRRSCFVPLLTQLTPKIVDTFNFIPQQRLAALHYFRMTVTSAPISPSTAPQLPEELVASTTFLLKRL